MITKQNKDFLDLDEAQVKMELTKLGAWHVNMVIPFVLPERFRRLCLDGIASDTGPVQYYRRVLRNNARYWELSALLDKGV